MEGQGVADLEGKDYNNGKGTLKTLLRDPAKARARETSVRVNGGHGPSGTTSGSGTSARVNRCCTGPLTVGFSASTETSHHFGPELQFGWVLGDHFANQVLADQDGLGRQEPVQGLPPAKLRRRGRPLLHADAGRGSRGPGQPQATISPDMTATDTNSAASSGIKAGTTAANPRTAVPQYEHEPGQPDPGRAQRPACSGPAGRDRRADGAMGAGARCVGDVAKSPGRGRGTARVPGHRPVRRDAQLRPQA